MGKLKKVQKCVQKGREEELVEFAKDQDKEVQLAAIAGMEQIGKDISVNALIVMLRHEDPDIRLAAVNALGKLRAGHADTHLRQMLQRESDETIKKAISEAIATLRKEGY